MLALNALFEKTGLTPGDVDTIEAQRGLRLAGSRGHPRRQARSGEGEPVRRRHRPGHPVGATGAILSLRVAKDLVRRDLELGVVTMCIGGGQALAALFRRV